MLPTSRAFPVHADRSTHVLHRTAVVQFHSDLRCFHLRHRLRAHARGVFAGGGSTTGREWTRTAGSMRIRESLRRRPESNEYRSIVEQALRATIHPRI